MNPAQQLRDREVTRLIREAEEAWGRQQYDTGIARLQRASLLDRRNPSLMIQVARAHGLRYDFAAADSWIQRALGVQPRGAEALTEAGRTCLEFDAVQLATRYLRLAAGQADVSIGALGALADLLLREGRLDEVHALTEQAERIDRADARVSLLKAAVARARGDTATAESVLRATLAGGRADHTVRVRGLYELAAILDGGGRYDESMATLLEVKALLRPHAHEFVRAADLGRARLREMEQTVTAPVLSRWRAAAPTLAPPRRIALLCGHPRSGTTLLEQVLDTHPAVASAEETALMHDEAYLPVVRGAPQGSGILGTLDQAPPELLRRARANYFQCARRRLGCALEDRTLIDKNPALNALIPMVVRVFPEARFIVAVRDPRDVVLSCFMQNLPLTPVSCAYLSLEEAARQYAAVMAFWLAMRERLGGGWIEVRYEDLVADLEGVSRRVLTFLGLEFDEAVLKYYEHARLKRISSPSHADVLKPVYRSALGRWRHYERYLAPCIGTLAPFLREFKYA